MAFEEERPGTDVTTGCDNKAFVLAHLQRCWVCVGSEWAGPAHGFLALKEFEHHDWREGRKGGRLETQGNRLEVQAQRN